MPTRTSTRLPTSLTATSRVLRRHLWIWPLVAVVLLVGVGWWANLTIESATRAQLAHELETLLRADVEALEIWIESQFSTVQAAARSQRVQSTVGQLLQLSTTDNASAALIASRAQQQLRERLEPLVEEHQFAGYVVTDARGRVIASWRDEAIGRDGLAGHDSYLSLALAGEVVLSRPFASAMVIEDQTGAARAGVPTMFVAAPIRGADDEVLAVLALRIQPQEFTRIFAVARSGETGETYAFDRAGVMISQSRFDGELKRIGLLPNRPEAVSTLNIEVRDPGVDLTLGEQSTLQLADRPLTRMAASAIENRPQRPGRPDVDTNGYRDYRGRPVIGAWTWLDGYGFGVTTEIDLDEAYGPIVLMRRAFWALIGLLVFGAAVLLGFTFVVSRLERSYEKVVLKAKQLGQYALEEKIGAGGMGEVYRARHAMLRRPTAVKLLNVDRGDEASIARFEREVQLTSQLNHPHTIAIYDFGRTPEGIFYYAMEYLDGVNLDDFVKQYGPQPEGRVIQILDQICGSLAEAHRAGLIHRDVKPANVILGVRGGIYDFVKVLDFGLVKSVDSARQVTVTMADSITGTPSYVSPEGIDRPQEVDKRSDLYAVGAVGYFLLTGTATYRGESVMHICMQQLRVDVESPSARLGRAVSADLEALVLECLAIDRDSRPASAEEVSRRLAACVDASTWTQTKAANWWRDHDPQPSGVPAGNETRKESTDATTGFDTSEMTG